MGWICRTYPSGVPTPISVPAVNQTTTDPATVLASGTTTISLLHPAIPGTLAVTATPSGGSTAVTLAAGVDYTLGTDASGNTQITFNINSQGKFAGAGILAAGATINSHVHFRRTTGHGHRL